MHKKKVLILSEAFGDGHTKAAEAIKHGLYQYDPNCEVHVIELGIWLRPALSKFLAELYFKTLQYSPKIWGMMYKKIQFKPVQSKTEFLLHRILYTKIALLLKSYQPDMIICTHPFPSAVISRLKKMGLQTPLYTAITDYGVHGSWISSEVDQYFVASPEIKKEMMNMGVPANRLVVTGIPVHPKFWTKKNKMEVQSKLNISTLPTILCMGGGMGLGLTDAFVECIYTYLEHIQILFVAGKNENLYQSIQKNSLSHHPNFKLYSYVKNIDELMDAADLLITKPGGITCTEAMAKGLPLLLLPPIPGQEEENMRFVINHQFGQAISCSEELKIILNHIKNKSNYITDSFKVAPHCSGQKAIQYFSSFEINPQSSFQAIQALNKS